MRSGALRSANPLCLDTAVLALRVAEVHTPDVTPDGAGALGLLKVPKSFPGRNRSLYGEHGGEHECQNHQHDFHAFPFRFVFMVHLLLNYNTR